MLTKGLLHYTIIKHIIDEGFAPDLKTFRCFWTRSLKNKNGIVCIAGLSRCGIASG